MASRYDDIIAAYQALLATLTVANGYSCDAGARVHTRDEYKLSDPEKPCLILVPGDLEDDIDGPEEVAIGEEMHRLPISITGIIDDSEGGSASDALRLDLLKVIKSATFLGGLTHGFDGPLRATATVSPAVTFDADGTPQETGGFLGAVECSFVTIYSTAYGDN